MGAGGVDRGWRTGNAGGAESSISELRWIQAAMFISASKQQPNSKVHAGRDISSTVGPGPMAARPQRSALDGPLGRGSVYFIDNNLTVRKVTPIGILSTVAGGGLATADGTLATKALILPVGIAVDAAQILHRDFFLSAIRKVTNGVIATVAARAWASAATAGRRAGNGGRDRRG